MEKKKKLSLIKISFTRASKLIKFFQKRSGDLSLHEMQPSIFSVLAVGHLEISENPLQSSFIAFGVKRRGGRGRRRKKVGGSFLKRKGKEKERKIKGRKV